MDHRAAAAAARSVTVCRAETRLARCQRTIEEGMMAYSLKCSDLGMNCPGSFITESRQELLKHAELHGQEAHPGVSVPPEKMQPLIKQV